MELCFEAVGPTIPMPFRDVDLYGSRERLLKTQNGLYICVKLLWNFTYLICEYVVVISAM